MNENLKKFLEEASKNEELKAKLAALTDKETAVEKVIEIAKDYGFTLTAEDFQPADGAELSLDELNQVAGGDGGTCCCLTPGSGDDICGAVSMVDLPWTNNLDPDMVLSLYCYIYNG